MASTTIMKAPLSHHALYLFVAHAPSGRALLLALQFLKHGPPLLAGEIKYSLLQKLKHFTISGLGCEPRLGA